MRCQVGAILRRQDLLQRFTPLPYRKDLLIMARTVRLESNSIAVVESAMNFFARHQGRPLGNLDFLWRIIVCESPEGEKEGVALTAFSDHGLRVAGIGQRSFLAVDLASREGVGFVTAQLVEPAPERNCRSIFDTLFCMSAGALGLVPLSAACVGQGNRAILLFGPPNSGKTTVSYLAAKLGLEFHADHAAFLEVEAGKVRVWGDLLPAIFRAESLQFLPELHDATQRFSYPELTVHYLPKRPFQAPRAHSVAPICCVFLERQGATTHTLSPIDRFDLSCRLAESRLFQDDAQFARRSTLVLDALERMPAYHLAYDDNPATAVAVLRRLFMDCDAPKERHTVESDRQSGQRPEKSNTKLAHE